MTVYSIGDAERLLGVKAHVIRYWEKEIALIQPQKDALGRRLYSKQDLRLLLRIKYLLYERRFTVEGAREELFRELAGERQDAKALIEELRSQLLDLYFLAKNSTTRIDKSTVSDTVDEGVADAEACPPAAP
jgi:DNA-binding transcriptional MerR regulator